jgi:hypothetical protein
MSPVTQYVFDGTKWQNEVATSRSSLASTTADAYPFVLGETKPSNTTTGFDASRLTGILTGDQIIKTAGTTISNKRIEGYVLINAANVTLDNCEIVGRNVGYVSSTALIQCNSTGTLINRCEIRPQYPRFFLNGIGGTGFRAYRCHICNAVDGIAMKGDNCVAEGCYIHDLAFFDGMNTANGNGSEHPTDGRFPGWTHNDGVQIYGYSGNRVEGCNIQGYFSSTGGTYDTAMYDGCAGGNNNGRLYPSKNYAHGIFVAPTNAVLHNTILKKNWIEGGEVCIQSSNQNRGHDTGNSVTIDGNRFGCDQKPGYTGNAATNHTTISLISAIGTFSVVNNTYDTCASVPAANRGTAIGPGKNYSGMMKWEVTK